MQRLWPNWRSAQTDTAVRLEAMIGMLARGQTQLQHAVNERLDSVSHRLGDSLEKSKLSTHENLQKLNERLAVIDSAQKNITDLATPGDLAARRTWPTSSRAAPSGRAAWS